MRGAALTKRSCIEPAEETIPSDKNVIRRQKKFFSVVAARSIKKGPQRARNVPQPRLIQ